MTMIEGTAHGIVTTMMTMTMTVTGAEAGAGIAMTTTGMEIGIAMTTIMTVAGAGTSFAGVAAHSSVSRGTDDSA